MKRTLYFFFLIFLLSGPYTVLAQEKSVKPEIKEVTVFLNKAQLISKASAFLEAGTSEIIMEGLSYSIDPQSIQVSGSGNFTIHAVKFEENFLDPHKKSERLILLEDSLKFYQFQIDSYKDFEEVMKKEEEMLVANQVINGKEKALDADDLEYFANFYRKRLLDIRFQILKNKREIKDMQVSADRVQKQINSIINDNKPTGRIRVTAVAKSRTNANFEISYVVNNASWYPVYDVRVKDSEGPVNVSCKAMVRQNTGINWKNVKVTLSTTNPTISGVRPELTPWYIYSYESESRKKTGRRQNWSAPSHAWSDKHYNSLKKESYDGLSGIVSETDALETTLAVKFEINTPYTIPAIQSGQIVDVQNIDLPATYKHFTAPKLSDAAYLVALVTGYDDKNLLSGVANVYFEDTFIGDTYLDMNTTEDTLQVSLGKDNNIVVERVPVKEFRSKSFLGLNKKEEFAYEIKIRNTKNNSIDITIEDQVPVSQDEEIEVETVELSGAEKNDQSGMLIWKLNIPAAETQTINYRYSVKHPKSKKVKGLR